MGADSPAAPRDGALRWRLWAFVPAILLIGAVSATIAAGDSLDGLVAAVGSEEGQRANETLAEDEARFIDFERSSLFVTEEHTFLES